MEQPIQLSKSKERFQPLEKLKLLQSRELLLMGIRAGLELQLDTELKDFKKKMPQTSAAIYKYFETQQQVKSHKSARENLKIADEWLEEVRFEIRNLLRAIRPIKPHVAPETPAETAIESRPLLFL